MFYFLTVGCGDWSDADEWLISLRALYCFSGLMTEISRLSSRNRESFFSLSLRRISYNFSRGTCTRTLPELLLDGMGMV
jgi:hypothetical protein